MRITKTVVAAGLSLCAGVATVLVAPGEAAAQVIPPTAERDENWGVVSDVTMTLGASTVFLMPRVYYSSPAATVGWKARWHFSALAPAMSLTALTLLVDGPIKSAIESPRPGCTVDETIVAFPDSNCESFGGPSTHAFASWGATGAGLGIFLVDTIKYSDGRFHGGSFVGNVAVPLTASVVTSIARGVEPGSTQGYESGGQIVAGAVPGFLTGVALGVAYSLFQPPNCGYGNAIFCW